MNSYLIAQYLIHLLPTSRGINIEGSHYTTRLSQSLRDLMWWLVILTLVGNFREFELRSGLQHAQKGKEREGQIFLACPE